MTDGNNKLIMLILISNVYLNLDGVFLSLRIDINALNNLYPILATSQPVKSVGPTPLQ